MKNNLRKISGLAFLIAALAGCQGDKGDPGVAGPQGPGTVPVTSTGTALTVSIDSVTIASPPVVNFSIVNEKGIAFVGLTGFRFTLAKLVPGSNGDPSHWQSYVNTVETVSGSSFPNPNGTTAVQATSDRNGTLVDHGDGTYTYTFLIDVTNVTTPLAVTYEPALPHRLVMQVSPSGMAPINQVYDFRPSDGATTGLATRDIVQTASCNECHSNLALHGGSRKDTKYCVTCHNPGTSDAQSGNVLDMKVFIHKIHSGKELPSVVAGGEYVIWGFNTSQNDYSDVGYPQDIRNCTKCHDEADTATPDAANWHDKPSMDACGSCHDNIDWTANIGTTGAHTGGPQANNSNCTLCHSHNSVAGSVQESHTIPAKVAGAKFAYAITSVTNTAPGQFPVITYEVTDPTNANAPYVLFGTGVTPAWSNTGNGASRLGIDIAWSTSEFTNKCAAADFGTANCATGTTATSAPANPIALNGLAASSGNNATPVANGDGTYTVTSLRPVPADAVGSGIVAIEGHPAGDYDGDNTFSDRVPVKSVLANFAVTDATAKARRSVVDIAKCDQCHDQLSLHGSNRTDEPQLCVACHNPNATDVGRRGGVTGIDGLKEQAIDFKRMIHGIHASGVRENPFVVYGFGGSINDFSEVTFPGIINNCAACHKSGTFELPLADTVQGATVDTGASRPDPSDDLNITPTAAVCTSCHDSSLAQQHMEQNGASFSTLQADIDNGTYVETCAICHGPGRLADVDAVHSVQ